MPKSTFGKDRRPSSSALAESFQRAQQGDAVALQQLLALYRPLLMTGAQNRLRGPLRVKVAPSDLVQSTVWKATQGFAEQKFESRKGFLAWLMTILKNEAADARRRYRGAKKRDIQREQPLFSQDAQYWLSQLSATMSASDATRSEQAETLEQLSAALDRLPSHYRLVLRLRYFDRFDFGAIGEKLDRSYDAARVLHNRALLRLRAELDRPIHDANDSST